MRQGRPPSDLLVALQSTYRGALRIQNHRRHQVESIAAGGRNLSVVVANRLTISDSNLSCAQTLPTEDHFLCRGGIIHHSSLQTQAISPHTAFSSSSSSSLERTHWWTARSWACLIGFSLVRQSQRTTSRTNHVASLLKELPAVFTHTGG